MGWKSYGDESGKVIALIAPSDGDAGIEGQEMIKHRINLLVEKGFCVMVPEYEDGNLVVETSVEGRAQSRVAGQKVSPAVSADAGANQIIEAIENGWNIMPYMGGDNFQDKLPLIVQYFEANPDKKNPDVQIFGMSNSTYATILSSRGICSFTSTPFTSVFVNALTDPNFVDSANELERVMKGGDYAVASKVIHDPENKLKDLTQTFHYPLNVGNIFGEIGKEEIIKLQIPPNQSWSISVEGFLQSQGSSRKTVNYSLALGKFLELHKDHLPSFIEIGNLATRFDGTGGYTKLLHNEETGEILINDYNVDKVYEHYVKAIKEAGKNKSEGKPYSLPILPIDMDGIDVVNISKDDVRHILKSQNEIQKQVMNEIKAVTEKYGVPLTQNTRNGHCLNMSVVGGGDAKVEVNEGKMVKSFKNHSLEKPSSNVGHASLSKESNSTTLYI